MKELPVLFQGPMVRATLAGTKTQTRRLVKPWTGGDKPSNKTLPDDLCYLPDFTCYRAACPYGQPGDKLWVRETYFAYGRWVTRYNAKKGRDEWHFVDMTVECGNWYYYAEASKPPAQMIGCFRRAGVTPMWWKRPAIFMPRAASRVDLTVTNERVERLQDISEEDAAAEGWPEPPPDGTPHPTPRTWYSGLWDRINGAKPGASWQDNPWVRVISFKRVT